jgi:hypothetical protein
LTLNCMISSIIYLALLVLLTDSSINWFTISGILTLLINDPWNLSKLFTSFCPS